MAKTSNDSVVAIRPLEIQTITLKIVGRTPLIMHAWSEKAKRQMREAQMGKSKGKKKDVKNPVEDFIESLYWLEGKPSEYTEEAFDKAWENGARFGFPVTAIKQAAVDAAYRQGWTKNKVVLANIQFKKIFSKRRLKQ